MQKSKKSKKAKKTAKKMESTDSDSSDDPRVLAINDLGEQFWMGRKGIGKESGLTRKCKKSEANLKCVICSTLLTSGLAEQAHFDQDHPGEAFRITVDDIACPTYFLDVQNVAFYLMDSMGVARFEIADKLSDTEVVRRPDFRRGYYCLACQKHFLKRQSTKCFKKHRSKVSIKL